METKRAPLLILFALLAALQAAPAYAIGSAARDQGTLSEVDKGAIESMQHLMGERPDAQYAIGKIYLRGGLDREARTWINKSAAAGYPQAIAWQSEQKMKAAFRSRKGGMLASSRRIMAKGGE